MESLINDTYASIEETKGADAAIEYMLDMVPHLKRYAEVEQGPNTKKAKQCVTDAARRVGQRNYCTGVANYQNASAAECEGCGAGPEHHVRDNKHSDTICTKCGYAMHSIDVSSSVVYPFGAQSDIQYCYKRQNHFNEWLSQIQGKERTSIPSEIIDKLHNSFRMNRITQVDNTIVRQALKRLNLNKYYEHVPQITGIVSDKKPPQFTSTQEMKLRNMFSMIQDPFEEARIELKSKRKNFLSYSYVLHKFCQLLQYDDFLSCFPLLKSKDKLYQQDVIWKQMCLKLNWTFYKTV